MFGRWKRGHIHTDFRNDANSGNSEDTRHGTNKLYLVSIFFGEGQDLRLEVDRAKLQSLHGALCGWAAEASRCIGLFYH